MKKHITRMENRGIEQDKKARKREKIIILFIILIPLLIVMGGIIWGGLNPKQEYIINNGKTEKSITLTSGGVDDACKALGFKDYIITKQKRENGKIIVRIKPALHATIKSKETSITVRFTECTVRDLLKEKGFSYDDDDEITPPLDTRLKKDTEIVITDVKYEQEVETEKVGFEIENKDNPQLLKGQQKITQYGVYGEKQITYKVKYEDGKQTTKEVVSEEITKPPVNCIVENGTKEPETQSEKQQAEQTEEQKTQQTTTTPLVNTVNPVIPYQEEDRTTDPSKLSTAGRANVWSVPAGITDDTQNKIITAGDGSSYKYTSVVDVKATAYNRVEDGGLITAKGTVTKYGTIAVDPRVIPLGKKLYVVSDGGQSWSYGPGLAEDTGGLIKGNRIDLFFMTGDEATQFGVRNAKVYVLED